MKINLIIILFFPILLHGQSCDTLYSDENYIMRGIKIEYRDCQSIYVDSVYRVVQWEAEDSIYLTPYYSDNVCYSLLHSQTGKLIEKKWQSEDTIYFNSYYPSGKIKVISKSKFTKEPYYFHEIYKGFYENGQVREEFQMQKLKFSPSITYYPNGIIQTKTMYYDASATGFGDFTIYFANGQVSSIRKYSQPNTADSLAGHFQDNELLSEIFYDQNGIQVQNDLNEVKEMYISIYPPVKDEILKINDSLYTNHQFYNQKGYTNDMSELKNRILKNLKLPESSCKKGIIWLSLIIKKDGEIKIEEIQASDDVVKQSISKIKHWSPGVLDGKKIDTYVYTYLILDK